MACMRILYCTYKGISSQLSFTNKVLFPLSEINMKIIVIIL